MNATRPGARVAEIVGVAGVGKSTVTQALAARHDGLRVDDTLHARWPRHWPAAVRGAFRSLSVLVAGSRGPRRFRWDDVRFVLYVAGWGHRLVRRRTDDECVLMDQGPLFALARLRVSGTDVTSTATYRRWEARMIDEWARVLDDIVWLDADDRVLAARVNSRARPHAIKGAPPEVAERFLSDYRRAYDAIITAVGAVPQAPRVVRLDSSLLGADAAAAEVEHALALGRPDTPKRLDVLHLILVLGPTNSQFNEHCLPQMHARDISICTYFTPLLPAPPEIALFAGNSTIRGFFRALSRSLDAGEHDAVHAHAAQSGFMLMMSLASRSRRWRYWRRTVFTVHDSWYDFRPRNKLLMLPVFATFRRVVFCGQAAYESAPAYVKRLIGRRARVVQNAADLARVDRVLDGSRPQRDNAHFTVVAIARLEPVKDPMTLIDAFERSATPDSRLVVIGDGKLRDAVQQRVDDSPLSAQIELTGLIPRDEVFRRCAAADLFVSVSLGEGLPVAAMEAMGAGCPVVLSDIPPHRELVEGTTIPLVPCGDVAGFAAAIDRVRTLTGDERQALGKAAREHVATTFSLERMHRGYGRVYRELASRRAGS